MKVPFNQPSLVGNELKYMQEAIERHKLSGDGYFTKKCNEFLEKKFNVKKALLTTSCTHALEMAALLIDIKPGDEVIMPSFTFVSTANAFVLRGGVPVFVDIKEDTLNIDEEKIEQKINKKTKAIVPVHYAGIGCNMDRICEIASNHHIPVIEDAAQGVNAKYKDRFLGAIGDIGTYSFHETKNYYCGEGGAILINNPAMVERAEIIK
jgi:dTDP-4-amino-4,6-dideoxygalactose transaminase